MRIARLADADDTEDSERSSSESCEACMESASYKWLRDCTLRLQGVANRCELKTACQPGGYLIALIIVEGESGNVPWTHAITKGAL